MAGVDSNSATQVSILFPHMKTPFSVAILAFCVFVGWPSAHASFSLSTGKQEQKEATKPAPQGADAGNSSAEVLKKAESLKKDADTAVTEAERRARAEKATAETVLSRTQQLKDGGVVSAPAISASGAGKDAATAASVYMARKDDRNYRMTLKKWSDTAGWDFVWQVDRDLPVAGNAAFATDYRQSVRAFLAATDATDLPVRPCFHSNQVLRVIRKSDDCNVLPNAPAIAGEQR